MSRLALSMLVALILFACTAHKAPKATTPKPSPAAKQEEKADTNANLRTQNTHQTYPDTATTYTASDGGMTQTESKLFAHATSMQAVYQETLRKGDIEDAKLLLPKLPKKSKEVSVEQNGLISVSYTIAPQQATIEMFYEGGVTTLNLRVESAGIRRAITLSAD